MRKTSKSIMGALMVLAMNAQVHAATGGLSKAQGWVEEFKVGLYALIGAASALHLLYIFIQIKLERKQWPHFTTAVIWIAIGGACLTIGDFAWSFFR